MRQDLYEKINANDPGGTAKEAATALAAVKESKERPLDDRMLSERRVYAILGMEKGEVFMSSIEASTDVPARVKNWFKPSEEGVDVLDSAVAGVVASIVAGVPAFTQEDADLLLSFGHEDVPAYPGINEVMVQNARDIEAKIAAGKLVR